MCTFLLMGGKLVRDYILQLQLSGLSTLLLLNTASPNQEWEFTETRTAVRGENWPIHIAWKMMKMKMTHKMLTCWFSPFCQMIMQLFIGAIWALWVISKVGVQNWLAWNGTVMYLSNSALPFLRVKGISKSSHTHWH